MNPKGSSIYHPATVEVEILPPVDTSQWSAETIDDHVESVHRMFLKALEQDRTDSNPRQLRVVEK